MLHEPPTGMIVHTPTQSQYELSDSVSEHVPGEATLPCLILYPKRRKESSKSDDIALVAFKAISKDTIIGCHQALALEIEEFLIKHCKMRVKDITGGKLTFLVVDPLTFPFWPSVADAIHRWMNSTRTIAGESGD